MCMPLVLLNVPLKFALSDFKFSRICPSARTHHKVCIRGCIIKFRESFDTNLRDGKSSSLRHQRFNAHLSTDNYVHSMLAWVVLMRSQKGRNSQPYLLYLIKSRFGSMGFNKSCHSYDSCSATPIFLADRTRRV